MSSREKIIAVVMCSVIVIWGRMFLFKSSQKPVPVPAAPAVSAAKPQQPAAKGEGIFTLDEALARAALKQDKPSTIQALDPFQKFDPNIKMKSGIVEYTDLILTGIVWEEAAPVVIINDKILKVGDVISGFTIEAIQRNAVDVNRGEERHTLPLFIPAKEE